MTDDGEKFVNEVKRRAPVAAWQKLSSRKQEDAWDGQIRDVENAPELQAEMDTLAQKFAELQNKSILENYAFVPAHPKPISYLTSMFLHIGWLHLIGNMWFLWLARFIFEDRRGRVIYPIFFLLSCILC